MFINICAVLVSLLVNIVVCTFKNPALFNELVGEYGLFINIYAVLMNFKNAFFSFVCFLKYLRSYNELVGEYSNMYFQKSGFVC